MFRLGLCVGLMLLGSRGGPDARKGVGSDGGLAGYVLEGFLGPSFLQSGVLHAGQLGLMGSFAGVFSL